MIEKLIKILKARRANKILRSQAVHLKKGDSHFLNQFALTILAPKEKKIYLHVGDDTVLDCRVTFESTDGEVRIGNKCFIGNSHLISRNKIEIENNVFIAWGTYIYDHDSHSMDFRNREKDIETQLLDLRQGKNFIANKDWDVVNSKPIKICSNAWIGMNCIILKGVTIGEGAIVGAGSVVTRDVPSWTVVGGNPAKIIRELPIELRR